MVTKETKIGVIVKDHPEAVQVLIENGLTCVGCPMASQETLEQGAASHGIDVDKLVSQINKKLEK